MTIPADTVIQTNTTTQLHDFSETGHPQLYNAATSLVPAAFAFIIAAFIALLLA